VVVKEVVEVVVTVAAKVV
jgi:hypothetical protein